MTKLIAIALAFAMAAVSLVIAVIVGVKLNEPWFAADLLMLSGLMFCVIFAIYRLRQQGDAE